MSVEIEKTANLYMPHTPRVGKKVLETSVADKNFSVVQPQTGYDTVSRHLKIDQTPFNYWSSFQQAFDAYNNGHQANVVRLHRLAEVPHAQDGSTNLDEDIDTKNLPLVMVKRPPHVINREDLKEMGESIGRAIDAGDFWPNFSRSEKQYTTIGFLESVRQFGKHTELTIIEAETDFDDVPYTDDRTNYRFVPKRTDGNSGNLVRRKVWLESPLNRVYMVQGDVLQLEAKYKNNTEIKGLPRNLMEKVKLFFRAGKDQKTDLYTELQSLIEPMNPLIEVSTDLRTTVEELKQGLLAQILIAQQEFRRGRNMATVTKPQLKHLANQVAKQYLNILEARPVAHSESWLFYRMRTFDGRVKTTFDEVIAELHQTEADQMRDYQKTAVRKEIDRLQRLADLRQSSEEVFSATLANNLTGTKAETSGSEAGTVDFSDETKKTGSSQF